MKEPRCPECGFIFEEEYIWEHGNGFPREDGDVAEVQCRNPECNATLEITCCLVPVWDVETIF